MINLTQDIKRLSLHANFEAVCRLPVAKLSITHLCTLIRDTDPYFFSNNIAFDSYYYDEDADYSDFDLMVQALKDSHAQTLLEDNSSGFYGALRRYSFPDLPNEANWGDSVEQLLDALLSYSTFPAHYRIELEAPPAVDRNIGDAELAEAA